jgi:hypothetical protein
MSLFDGAPSVRAADKGKWISMDCLTLNATNAGIRLSKALDAADRNETGSVWTGDEKGKEMK